MKNISIKFGSVKSFTLLCGMENNMAQQEYNEWWFNHYCEMGVSGFPDPREHDNDFYDIWREQQDRYFEERFNSHFDNSQ